MDIDTQSQQPTQPINDDQELAKALAGISDSSIDFEETPSSLPSTPTVDSATSTKQPEPQTEQTAVQNVTPPSTPSVQQPSRDLDEIKKNALLELRPLMDKLDLKPEEKFDICLLLLRSTDDKTLIAPAHEAARSISDETKRAQALLDVIKEIDYLSNPTK